MGKGHPASFEVIFFNFALDAVLADLPLFRMSKNLTSHMVCFKISLLCCLNVLLLGEIRQREFRREIERMFQDKYLVCKDCGNEFMFSASEQEFYAEKGFENEPGRCMDCRRARKQERSSGFGGAGRREERTMFKTVCASCGQETTVPFEPTGERPVYCRECFQARRR